MPESLALKIDLTEWEADILTERLCLRTFKPEDVTAVYQKWMADPEIVRHTESPPRLMALGDLRNFALSKWMSPADLFLGIYENETGEHIGNIKVGNISPGETSADIGLIIGKKSRWGRGYAAESIRAVSEYARETVGLTYLYAGMRPENPGSRKAFLKAGYKDVEPDRKETFRNGRFRHVLLVEYGQPPQGER